MSRVDAAIERLDVAAYRVPTVTPQSDGTAEWDATTMVAVEVHAGGHVGLGYTYADAGAARTVQGTLAPVVIGREASAIPAIWAAMLRAIRNGGPPGLASMAVAAVDSALWDLKARMLGLSLAQLLGPVRRDVDVYASGGFTSLSESELVAQCERWREQGHRRAKIKVGREPERDAARVRAAHRALGPDVALFVDANGAYSRKEALRLAAHFVSDADVRWLEEPVSSEDVAGLRLIRDRAPAGLDIAAGEYAYTAANLRNLLVEDCVDVLQADATRCGGISGLLEAGALCRAFGVPLSSHCAPALHLHAAAALPALRHMEWFVDHERVESMLLDGAVQPREGRATPDLERPGHGLTLKRADAERYRVSFGLA